MAGRFNAHTWLGIGLSAALSAWFLWSVDWAALGEALRQVRVSAVAFASALLVVEFIFRAMRWKVLLRPVAPDARVRDLFTATVIGATANTLLPARAGEIAKPLVARQKLGVDLAPIVATAVMERVYDIFGLLSVLLVTLFTIPVSLGSGPEDAELVQNLKLYGSLFGLAAMGAMAVFFLLATRGGPARAIFVRITQLGPPPVARRFVELFDGFVAGLGNARDTRGLVEAGLLSLGIWFNGALAIAVLFSAFSLPLPFSAACFTGVAIALTVALPQAPGFFGVFHVAIEKTLVLWSVSVSPAKAFAIVFWGVSFLPVTLIGLLALWREGLSLSGIWSSEREEDAEAEPQVR
ncbi:MAG: flippase-like domain-containing protein [Alphaproteobacteria bacterium]|nr:flippase-like domain-containing protein [Alphaproteobacteria bacterium]MCB9791864.1 flippase-like domain-containing protein [Alphaproteobacteria bacterium]